MRHTISCPAIVLSLAAPALHAQPTGFIQIDSTGIAPQQTREFFIVIDDDGSTAGLFAFDIAVRAAADSVQYVDAFHDLVVHDDFLFGANGSLLPDGVTALGGSTDILGPDFDAPLNGFTVMSFSVTLKDDFRWGNLATENAIEFNWEIADGPGAGSLLQHAIEGGIVLLPGEYDTIAIGTSSSTDIIFRIPAPGSACLLAVSAILASRRRR